MKSLVFNRKSMLFSTLLVTAFGLNAQIESKHTDVKYGYTTVVYKEKAATDQQVLDALDNSVGMGDVVRVTVAPPKPAIVPIIDKSKGEDTWLKPTTTINGLTAATTSAIPNITPGEMPVTVATPVPVAIAKAAPVAANPVVKKAVNAPKVVTAPENAPAVEKIAAAPKTVKSKSGVAAKSAKSSKKFVHKSGGSFKMKNHKKGKQRYSCPKF